MKPSKPEAAILLTALLAVSGCAYFRPDPSPLPSNQGSQEQNTFAKQEESDSPVAGLIYFLEQVTYEVFKGYQEMGR